MERTLLSGLSWRCHTPTAHQVGLSILSLLLPYVDIPEVTWGYLMDETKYLTELAVRDYYFSTKRTSTIALAAILNAIGDMTTGLKDLMIAFLRVIVDVERFDFDHPKQVAAAIKRLRLLAELPEHLDMEETNLDDSEKTYKVSNTSTQRGNRDLEDHSLFSYQSDASGKVHNVSLRSSLHDVSDWSDEDFLHELSCNDHH